MKSIFRPLLLTLAVAATASSALAQNILLQPAKTSDAGLLQPKRDLGETVLRTMGFVIRSLPAPLVASVFNQITQPLPGVVQPALPDQIVGSLPGQLEGPLPDQVVRALPGQIQPALPGQVVPALPGQMIKSVPGN